jgi:carboxypeptidase PM20D1
MVKKIVVLISIALLVLLAIILFNTFTAKKWPVTKADPLISLPDSAIQHMSAAIQIKTITSEDTLRLDTVQFDAFKHFLETAYPLVHQHLKRILINDYNYIFEWKGTDSIAAPIVLMAHYDVVPVEESALKLWTAQPFGGEVKNHIIWGRGAVDDKVNVISILEAAEGLLQKGFPPKQTILLCFGCNEELSGTGAQAIVRYLAQKNIRPSLVLDEGGEITREELKDVDRPIAVIGVAEKGYVTFELSVEKPGGHSSQPAKETAIDILTKALYQLRSVKPEASIIPPIKTFLTRISGATNNFAEKMALTNLWLLKGVVINILGDKPSGNAMLRTTIVPTVINSGVRENVIPSEATALINSRILPGDTRQSVQDFITKAINDERVKISIKGSFSRESSSVTDINNDAYKKVESAIGRVMDSVITTPYIMLGGTDSRYYRSISDGVVNFSPCLDFKGYHGINERLPVTDLQRCISFFTILMKG